MTNSRLFLFAVLFVISGDVFAEDSGREVSSLLTHVASVLLVSIIAVMILYSLRHYAFTYNRLFGEQRSPFLDIPLAQWPTVTVLVAAHNEETVIADALEALLVVDYPQDRISIVPVNDRSTDDTRSIIDRYVRSYPGRITPYHREGGKPGKSAALKDVTEGIRSEIIVVFDADYIPSPKLIKQLVAPFFDPEVGATMGRVVPQNVGTNFLTRLLDMERSGGYQVDQQARMNLFMVPQYGGTCGGVRVTALMESGGWHDDVLAEDTDLTYRLLLNDWKVVYQNRAECYEEVPESWAVRVRQIGRWAKGHNQAMVRHAWPLLKKRNISLREKLDGLVLLSVFVMAPMLIVGWILAIYLYYFSQSDLVGAYVTLFTFVSFSALGNFAGFFQIAAASRLDGNTKRLRLLPLIFFGFVVSAWAITRASFSQCVDVLLRREMTWDKTRRYRRGR